MRIMKPILALALVAQLSSCATTNMRHASAERFMLESKKIDEINSIQSSSYIGSSGNRAYIETQSLFTFSGKPKTTVFWTELDQLPESDVNKLR